MSPNSTTPTASNKGKAMVDPYKLVRDPMVRMFIDKSGPGVFVPFEILEMTGDPATAMVFSQMIYWSKKMGWGWFYKTDADWCDELKISRKILRRVIHGNRPVADGKLTLQDLGIEVKKHMANGKPTNHYRVNLYTLQSSLSAWYAANKPPVPDGDNEPESIVPDGDNGKYPTGTMESTQRVQLITGDYAVDYQESVAPDEPTRQPAKTPTHQQMLVGALFEAFGISNPTGPDRGKAGKVAKELEAVGIAADDVPDLVAFVRRQAAGQWTVTMNSLISNGRVSAYLEAKARTEQTVTMVTDDEWDPAAQLPDESELEAGRLRVEANKLMAQGIVPNPNWRDRLPDYMRGDN